MYGTHATLLLMRFMYICNHVSINRVNNPTVFIQGMYGLQQVSILLQDTNDLILLYYYYYIGQLRTMTGNG